MITAKFTKVFDITKRFAGKSNYPETRTGLSTTKQDDATDGIAWGIVMSSPFRGLGCSDGDAAEVVVDGDVDGAAEVHVVGAVHGVGIERYDGSHAQVYRHAVEGYVDVV